MTVLINDMQVQTAPPERPEDRSRGLPEEAAPESPAASTAPAEAEETRRTLRHLERRAARLRAH
jgi:hypothetical protein